MNIKSRIVLVFVLVVAAGFYFLVQWIADDLRPRYLESLEEPLVDTANILAEMLAVEFTDKQLKDERLREIFQRIYQRRINARIYALEKNKVDMRIYITDNRGIVLFDSNASGDEGKDYSRWNDIYLTLLGQYGARSTNEDPLHPDSSVLYIAAPIQVDGELIGVVSVGKPAHNVDRFIGIAKQKLSTAGLVAAATVLALGLGLYAWVNRPLEQLVRYAQAVKRGERVSLPKLGRNEIGMMGAAIEEMRTALAGKDYAQRYVQTLTHELKSPLAAIRGASELLQEEMPNEQRQHFLSNIHTETRRLQDLVDRMLELAALEKRQSLDKVESINLNALVRETVTSFEALAALGQVTVSCYVEEATWLNGERFLLRQAIANLLRNAIEFSPAGGHVVITSAIRHSKVELNVRDNGPGVPNFALPKVFDRFYSLSRPDGRAKSTGLGLTLVKEVAELHGGSAVLRNRPQGGAVATLNLSLNNTTQTER